MKLAGLFLELVVLTEYLFVCEVLHVLVDAELHEHVQLRLSEDEQREHEHADQDQVHEEDRDVVAVASVHSDEHAVGLLKPDHVEKVEGAIDDNLGYQQVEQDRFAVEVGLLYQQD